MLTLRMRPRPNAGRPAGGRAAAQWAKRRPVALAGVALVAAQLGWTAILLAHSYFRQDDFALLDGAVRAGFGWSYLMTPDQGHLMPVGLAIIWVLARVSLYNWLLASAVITVLVAAALLALLRALLTLFGARPGILVPLTLYLFAPLSVGTVAWLSAAVKILPLELALFLAADAHVRYLRAPRPRPAVAAACWLLLGLASADQGAVVPLLLFAMTTALVAPAVLTGPATEAAAGSAPDAPNSAAAGVSTGTAPEASDGAVPEASGSAARTATARWAEAARQALTRYRRVWLLYGALLAAYCALFFTQLSRSGTALPGPGQTTSLYRLAGTMIGVNAVPGMLGGPWHWVASGYAQAGPPAALEYASWVLAAAVIAASVVRRRGAWSAWAILLGWIVIADIVPVAIEGFGGLSAATLGADTGYLTDATAVLALCIGLAFLPAPRLTYSPPSDLPLSTPSLPDPLLPDALLPAPKLSDPPLSASRPTATPLSRPARVVALSAVIVVLAGAAVSLPAFVSATPSAAARSYIATARVAVAAAPPATVVIDGPVPAAVMSADFFPAQASTARVIAPLAGGGTRARLSWMTEPDGVLARPMMFDASGRLRPLAVAGPSSVSPPTGGCWTVTPAGTSIGLDGSLYRWQWIVRLSYSGPGGVLAVGFGGNVTPVTVPAGQHDVYLPEEGQGRVVTARFLGSAVGVTCVTSVTVGSPQPNLAGQAIPAVPIPG
jgi:hypothetical protein